MARKLKTYQTSIGFFDLAVAAPSMKAALEVWGADSNLFHQGFAKETDDPDVVAVTTEHPGIVLRRPVGTNGAFKKTAGLPTGLASGIAAPTTRKAAVKPRPSTGSKVDEAKVRQAAASYEKEQRKREAADQREEQARAKERGRKEAKVTKAQAAFDAAEKLHEASSKAIATERDALEERARSENQRWDGQREKLKAALLRAKAGD
jgi:colicin import membrane protein